MELSDRRVDGGLVPAPGLLILTGASHTGKTTVALAVLDAVPPPAALLSVDEILAGAIVRPPESVWEEIPLAYELLAPQLETLLERGWFVVVESTFTFVPDEGPPQLHSEQLGETIAIAERRRVPWLLVQMVADDDLPRDRAERSGRLESSIVDRTVELHRTAQLPEPLLKLEAGDRPPDELARTVLTELTRTSSAG